MPLSLESATLTVALLGNPNTGKSTLFSALAGIRQRVGNYPGVTVEKKTGQMTHEGRRFELIDLPGLYSLAPRSRDEMVSVDVLLGRLDDTPPVDAVVCIVDASNLERNLYLVSQVLELGLPTVVALNMVDVAEAQGVRINVDELGRRLGVPVVTTQAHRRIGVAELKSAIARTSGRTREGGFSPMPEAFEAEATRLDRLLAGRLPGAEAATMPRYLLRRLLLDTSGYLRQALLPGDTELTKALADARDRLSKAGYAVPDVETAARYDWVHRVLEGVLARPEVHRASVTDRIDRVLTHRVWGMLIFAVVMALVFQAVFTGAAPLMNGIDAWFASLGRWVAARMAAWGVAGGSLESLAVDGVIGGIGGVMVFLPQILILFFFIAILEDCGYMARAAYLMDRAMVRVGLSGKSFIPMLSSFACSIPGIMSARVIENERDRLTTILVAPLMTCSARLPVYALLIAAFIPARMVLGIFNLQGLVLVALYGLGIVTAVAVALVLKRTLLRGAVPPFVMELPVYKWPSPRTIFFRMLERAVVFLRNAGTIILALSIVIWAALYYPHDRRAALAEPDVQQLTARLAQLPAGDPARDAVQADLDHALAGAYQRQSWLARAGRSVEPVFRPLGWDWRISCAVIASFPAREVVVATLGVIFNLGNDVDASSDRGAAQFKTRLIAATWEGTGRKLFNVPVALSMMVFFALCAQCAATLAVMKRETNSWRWPAFAFGYMTMLAYLGAMLTYQLGMWIGS